MASKDPLLEPFQLKHLTLKNRVMSTSHEPAYTEDRMPKRRYRLYQEERAKGGLALTMFGGSCTVAPDSPAAFGNIDASTDEVIPYYRMLVDRVHRHGCAIMNQITHLGRRTSWEVGRWLPLVSASCVREMAHRAFPKEAEKEDLARIARAYGPAARRSKDGGLDGVEIESYGHLLDSFWSPTTTKRGDEYGGGLENRMRFGLEVLEEIRRQVGPDFIVGIRMAVDERKPGGFDETQGFEIAGRIVETGMVDFLNVIVGHVDSDEGMSHVIPLMGTPGAPFLDTVRKVKETFGLPVFHAARINDPATARHAIESGAVDMVGMTRAHMADPHIVAKIERGEETRIRPCVGAGYCIDQIYSIGAAYCLHNPATGREETVPHVIARSERPERKIVVVGAGPAGLEAARVSAQRGHRVVLFEAADKPGGQVLTAAQAPRRRELIGVIDWLAAEVARLGVDVRFSRFAEAANVSAEAPDIVVIATGGSPHTGFLERGSELVATTWDILNRQVAPAASVLLYDENGREPGPTCAEFLVAADARVEFVTPDRMIGHDIGGTNYPAMLKSFYENGVRVTTDHHLVGVRRDGNKLVAELYNDYTRRSEERTVDQVVAEHGTLPVDGLYFALKPRSTNLGEIDIGALIAGAPQPLANNPDGEFRLFRVGDAVASRNIHAAIYDSLRLCKAF